MAIDFYELGKQSGARTPEKQQSNFGALVGGLTNTIDSMIKASQLKTAALQAAMPQGIAIEKVPEELRAQATEFLTMNKKAYTDASAVLASGINSQSQRYRDAVETVNSVNTKFENLSTSLEGVALKRQAALDDPDGYSPSTSKEDRLTWGNLSNGDLYSNMTFNDDGTVNYTNSKGESKSFADFNVSPQSFEGQNTFLALNDKFTNAKYSGKTDQWSMHSGEAEATVNALFQKLKPAGQKDMMMADVDYLEKTTGFESGTDEYDNAINGILENPNDAIAGYKQHILVTLENNYNAQRGPKVSSDKSSEENGSLGQYGTGFGDMTETGGDPDAEIPKEPVLRVPSTDKARRRKNLKSFEQVNGIHYTYKYDKNDEGGWAAYEGTEFVRNMDGAEVAGIEGLQSLYETSDSDFNQEQVQEELDTKEKQPKKPNNVGIVHLQFEGNTTKRSIAQIEKNLHNIFDDNFKKNFTVEAVVRSGFSPNVMYYKPAENQMKITNKNTGEEKIYSIGTDATQEVVDEINKDFADYIKADRSNKDYQDPVEE